MAYIDDVNNILQIQPNGMPTVVRLSQNENGRNLYFTLSGNESAIPSTVTVTISGTKPDGNVYSGTGSITNNVILIEETVQMTAVAGTWDAKIQIISGGNTIATGRIRFVIDADTVEPGSVPSESELNGLVAQAQQYAEDARSAAYGSPLTASTASAMIDKARVYVYTGSESGYTAGHWYYWNGSAWTDGGAYNSTGVQTDTTLSVSGVPADAKATGDAITAEATARAAADTAINGELSQLKEDLFSLADNFVEFDTTFIRGGLSNTGEINTETHRIVTQDIISYEHPIFIKCMDANYMFRIAVYNSDLSFNHIELLCADQMFVPEDTLFRLVIAKVAETATPADISLFRTKVLYQTEYTFSMDEYLSNQNVSSLDAYIKKRFEHKYYTNGVFVFGGYRSIAIPLIYPVDITITNADSSLYQFNVKKWSTNKAIAANYLETSGWVSDNYVVQKNTYFTLEFMCKNGSVTPFPTNGEMQNLITFTAENFASDIIYYNAVRNAIVESQGYYNVAGLIVQPPASTLEVYTQKLPAKKGMMYAVELEYQSVQAMWGAYALFDIDGNFVSRNTFANVMAQKKSFDIEITADNIGYISFCYRTYGAHSITISNNDLGVISTFGFNLLNDKVDLQNYAINENINSVNHRGYCREAPENTLPAYKLSKRRGFKMVECDVSFTSDGVAVLLHDGTINRTGRNADGSSISSTINISDITYEQALEYDFGIWFAPAFAGTKIPTLEQFIALCRNIGLHPYIEIKEAGLTQANVNTIVEIVRNCGMAQKVTWISFSATALQYVLAKNPKARVGLLANSIDATVIATAQGLQNNTNDVFIDSGSYTDTEVALCQNADIPLEVWNFASTDAITALPTYASGITSDNLVGGYVLYQKNI